MYGLCVNYTECMYEYRRKWMDCLYNWCQFSRYREEFW